ncbi:hypothetical protein BSPLISOX_3337 [uncultured Gammaproteobacteria bacterium]|nr:hypothetical protein BSPLISOX_3337 [uncultured Gammaproteobacteria bacterium]
MNFVLDDNAIKSLSISCIYPLNAVKIQASERFLTSVQSCQDDKANSVNHKV